MSDLIEPLSTFVEFSVGIAGFTGIIAAVARSSAGNAELRLFRFRNLLITAFAPGFLSALTICLIYSGLTEDLAVQISSGALLLYVIAWAGLVVKTMPAGSPNRILTYFMWSASLLNSALQILNLSAATSDPIGLYFFGLTILLLQAAIVFATLALDTLMTDRLSG